MAVLDPWAGSPKLWRGAPSTKYKAAIVASREARPEVARVARMVAERARENLANAFNSPAESWTGGITNLRIEVNRGAYTDYHVNLVATGKAGMSEDDVEAALYSLENGRRSYKNKFGRKIPALQGYKILARAV